MKQRKAETLVEVVIAFAAFGVLLGGVTDFMANQLQFIARTKHRDELMYYAQLYAIEHPNFDYVLESPDLRLSISRDNNILRVKKGEYDPMDFTLP